MKPKGHLFAGGLFLFALYSLSLVRVHLVMTRLQALREAHPPGTALLLKGTVVSLPIKGKGSYKVRAEVPFLVEVTGHGEAPRAGDLIEIWGRVSPLDTFKNPWSMDRRAWYTQQGIAFPLYARRWELLKARDLPFYRQVPLDFASWGIARFKRDLGDEAGSVASSLVLGFRRGLDWETRQLFTSTGLGHLLAVSGFHMGVVFLFLYTIVRLFLKTYSLLRPPPSMDKLPSRRALLPSLGLLFFYLLVTGSPPSAQRAFIMIACWVLAQFWSRDRSLEGALVLAFLVMTLANPTVITRVGFQLTFAAMVGVAAVLRWIESLEGWKAILGGYLAMALVIPLFTLPFILFHFHRLSPYSPLANLLFVFPAALLVTLGLTHLLLAPLHLQGWLIPLEKGAMGLFTHGLALVSHLPGSSLWVTRKEALFLSALVVTGLTGIFLTRKGLRWALVLPLGAFLFLAMPHPRGALVLDMGKRGRALLFQGEKTVLVDAGVARGRGAWSSLRNALLWRDVHILDALVVSRIIPSRARLVPRVLETFKVKSLLLPTRGENRELERHILRVAQGRTASVVRVKTPMKLGEVALKPRGSKCLAVKIPSMKLAEGPRGWLWRERLLKPWKTGAVAIPPVREPEGTPSDKDFLHCLKLCSEENGPPSNKPFKNPSLCSK